MGAHYEDSLNREIDRLTTKVQELEAFKTKAQWLFDQLKFESSGQPFICGLAGEKDRNGMPEAFLVCAAYGSDAVYRYNRELQYAKIIAELPSSIG